MRTWVAGGCCHGEQMAGEKLLQDLLPVKSCPLEVEA